MESLMDQGILLRSDCGGKGICGKCRVKIIINDDIHETRNACTLVVSEDISIEIPESSMLSPHIVSKAPVSLPASFKGRFKKTYDKDCFGIAADLGTTTIAIYFCNTARGEVLSSIAVKNPQALYGDDVMSRIGAIGQNNENLGRLQKMVVRAMEWGIKELLKSSGKEDIIISQMVIVGNPTMIHILAGVDPKPIGTFPYQPVFYEPGITRSKDLGFTIKDFSIQTLPQVSGFIGGDILSAALAVELENQPEGTLLVDLGTNGELVLKGNGHFFATSCATGPAFEGASISCGMQAIPGAVNRVEIKSRKHFPVASYIHSQGFSNLKPSGICGTGLISAVAEFCRNAIIEPSGVFRKNANIQSFDKDISGKIKYILVPKDSAANGSAVFISQKDIRSVQLGKAALITGIEFLLREACLDKPEKIIVAGAFGSYLNKKDMRTLGMIPRMDPDNVEVAGNSAGSGAIMVLCDNTYLEKAIQMASQITVVDLACNQDFQEVFIRKLNFPI